MSALARLVFPDGKSAEFETSPVLSILVSAGRAGIRLRHDCGGKAICATCRVKIKSGVVSPADERESKRLAAAGAGPEERLACQARAGSDLELEALFAPGGRA